MTDEDLLAYKIIDLTDEKGFLCGRLLGDMGADVIKVEKPGGDFCRNIPPFYKDIPHSEKSLYWFAYNANKRGITLDIETVDGQAIFNQLVEKTDVIVESFHPGYMNSLHLGYDDLAKINPGLVMVSISPFGQDGPGSRNIGGDGVIWSMGGMTYLAGDPDRPPVRISFPQSYLHAGAAAFLGATLALYERDESGQGQHVDISIQECVVQTMMNAIAYWDLQKTNLRRAGQFRTGLSSTANQRLIWPCQDGFVNFPIFGGIMGAKNNRTLTDWMEEEGSGSNYMNSLDWDEFDMAHATQEQFDQLEEDIGRFFLNYKKETLYDEARRRRIMLYPVYTSAEITGSPQLAARGFWQQVDHPELGEELIYPGAFAKFSEGSITIKQRAPLIGEHNENVYLHDLGLSLEDMATLKQAKVI